MLYLKIGDYMKKIFALILTFCLFTGCQQTSSKTDDKQEHTMKNDTVIIDNNKSLKIGDTIKDMSFYLNDYDTTEIESSAVFYKNDDIEIFVGANEKIRKITLLNDTYQIDNGIKVGTHKKEVQKVYQEDEQEDYSYYVINQTKIAFTYQGNYVSLIELECV